MNECFTGNPSDHEAFVRIVDPSNYAVAVTNLSRGTIPVRAGLNWAQNFAAELADANETITASRTLVFNDSGKFLICDSGSAIVLTVPSDSTAKWAGAVTISSFRKGVGAVTFAAGDGVTIRGDLSSPDRYCVKTIIRVGTNEWSVKLIHIAQTDRIPSHYAGILQRDAHRCKGEIGVGNKGVIALRTDDWQDALRTTIQPLLVARGLPWSHALIDGFQTEQPWGAGTTWANLQTWSQNGMEVWSHGFDHKDYLGWDGLVRNVVTSKSLIEAQGFKVQGFSLPGVTSVYTEDQRGCASPYNNLAVIADYASKEGALICETYPLSEAYVTGSHSQIPCSMYHGRGHVTLDSMTLAAAKAVVDEAALRKTSVRFMWHSGNIGQATYMTLVDFTAFLDYVVSLWDAGTIEVVTPSALPFVTKSTNRLDLLTAGDFTGVSAGTPLGWKNVGNGHTIFQTGGIDDGPYCDVATSGPSQRPEKLFSLGLAGETFLFEGWTKSMGGSTTTARVIIQDYPTPTNLNLSKTFAGIGNSTWTRVRVPFTIPTKTAAAANIETILIMVTRSSGNNTGWAKCSVKKV